MKFMFLSILCLMLHLCSVGQSVSGEVRSSEGNLMPYVSVLVDSGGKSTVTNSNGKYSIALPVGTHTISFSYLGYEIYDKEVTLSKNTNITLNVKLVKQTVPLAEAEVVANSRDRAREIMKQVRDARKTFLTATNSYEVNLYQFITLESKLRKPAPSDSVLYKKSLDNEDIKNPFEDEVLEVTEHYSTVYYKALGKYKEKILGINTYDETKLDTEFEQSATVGTSSDFGENIITPQFQRDGNVFVLFKGASILQFNLYESLLEFDGLTDKPIVSPLAPTSAINYKFDYLGAKQVNEEPTFAIKVTPLNKVENLFQGTIYVHQNNYALVRYDLAIIGGTLLYAHSFGITADLSTDSLNNSVISNQEINYVIREGRRDIEGRVVSECSDYQLNTPLENVKFDREIKFFDPLAFDRDSTFWNKKRALSLDSTTLKYIEVSDSITNYYESPEYLAMLDSAFNKINIWTPLLGYGRRNREKGNEYYIEGLLGQIVPFGVGGYRHRLPGYFKKDFKRDFTVKTQGFLDYGFANEDVKGKLRLEFDYNSEKFMRTSITLGDYYDMVNDFASLEQTFSRNNFIRTKNLGIAQRMEIINGLYAELAFDYQDQLPLTGLDLSEDLFGELNAPLEFERYVKSEVRLQMEYRIRQEYYYKKNRKMVIPSDLPTLTLVYRKGINGLFNSEVNFDYLELGAKQEIEVGRLGSTRWEVSLGSFLNQKDLRVLEYKFFRGSDQFVFSDPLRSFQLLGPTLNTPNEYFRANVIHHFEGTILNKVPLIRHLKLGLAVGGGTLNIPDSDFYHGELFAGVEKPFRLFKQMLRAGVYGVTADNSFENSSFTWKVGLTFFEPFTRKWGY